MGGDGDSEGSIARQRPGGAGGGAAAPAAHMGARRGAHEAYLEPLCSVRAPAAQTSGAQGDEDASNPTCELGSIELVASEGRVQECAPDTEWLDDVGVCTQWPLSAAAANEDECRAGVVRNDRGSCSTDCRDERWGGSHGDDVSARRQAESTPVTVNSLGGSTSRESTSTCTDSELSESSERVCCQGWLAKRWASRLCACNLLLSPCAILCDGEDGNSCSGCCYIFLATLCS